MQFTQFIFPNGRRELATIELDQELEALAAELGKAGWQFQIECHPTTQLVNMDCCDEDEQLAMELVKNGPDVPGTVEKLVRKAHERWVERGRPLASGKTESRDSVASDCLWEGGW